MDQITAVHKCKQKKKHLREVAIVFISSSVLYRFHYVIMTTSHAILKNVLSTKMFAFPNIHLLSKRQSVLFAFSKISS